MACFISLVCDTALQILYISIGLSPSTVADSCKINSSGCNLATPSSDHQRNHRWNHEVKT